MTATREAAATPDVLEVYPGPGNDAYRSERYAVEVYDGTAWQPVYLYCVARRMECYGWHRFSRPSISFATIGVAGAVNVRITKHGGAIGEAQISPKSKAITAVIRDGKACFTLRPNDKVWVTLDGVDAHPVFLFADAPKPEVPADAEYFGPGVHTIGKLHRVADGRAVYLDGGAWVRGNLDIRGCHNVTIMGPGVLSGELWGKHTIEGKSCAEIRDYVMIVGSGEAACRGNRVEGVTIVDTPTYCSFRGLQQFYSAKLISPWVGSTDGFYITPNPDETVFVDQCFAFVGDDVFFPRDNNRGNMEFKNSFVSSSNNNIFCMSYWANPLDHDYTMRASNIDIKVTPEHAIFQCVIDGRESDSGVKNHLYEDIRIEGDLNWNCRLVWIENRPYPFRDHGTRKGESCFNGNTRNLRFRNISVEGQQNLDCRKSRIFGKDSANGHADICFENLTINGVTVTEANRDAYVETNEFASDIRFVAGTDG